MKINWQKVRYAKFSVARTADVKGNHLYVHREKNGSTVFVGEINGKRAITAEGIDAACLSLVKYYRESLKVPKGRGRQRTEATCPACAKTLLIILQESST